MGLYYKHFPTTFVDNKLWKTNANWHPLQPRAHKYSFKKDPVLGNKIKLIEMRLVLDQIIVDKVVFDPYKLERDLQQSVVIPNNATFCSGPLFNPSGYVMYDQHRIMRQLHFKQEVARESSLHVFRHDLDKCKSSSKKTFVAYTPTSIQNHLRERE